MRSSRAGFTLIELLIVLAIIGAIASVVLPNLGLTLTSQMNTALRDFTNTVRGAYDSAVLTGRIHRLVMQIRTGDYWIEAAPAGYEGRPPITEEESSASTGFNADARARLLEELDKLASEPRKSSDTTDRFYGALSPLIVHRSKLKVVKWFEVDDAVLYKRSLTGSVTFAAVLTEAMLRPLTFADASPKQTAYVYFFPSGTILQSSIQLTTRSDDQTLNDNGPKFSIVVDPLTGKSEVLEGFQDADFAKK